MWTPNLLELWLFLEGRKEVVLPCNSSNDTTGCSFKNEPPKAHTEAEQLGERIDEGVGRKLRQGR